MNLPGRRQVPRQKPGDELLGPIGRLSAVTAIRLCRVASGSIHHVEAIEAGGIGDSERCSPLHSDLIITHRGCSPS
jgi:hypothetical protein